MSSFEETTIAKDLWLPIFLLSLRDQEKEVTLKEVTSRGSEPIIRYLSKNLSQEDKDDTLDNAAFNGNTLLVDLLIKAGANIRDYTLIYASIGGHLGTVQYLLKTKEFSRGGINSSFHLASSWGRLRILEELNKKILAEDEEMVYFESVPPYKEQPDVFLYLLDLLSIESKNNILQRDIRKALEEGDMDTYRKLVYLGQEIDIQNYYMKRDLNEIRSYIEEGKRWEYIIKYAQDHSQDFLRIIDEMRDDGFKFTPSQEKDIEDLVIRG